MTKRSRKASPVASSSGARLRSLVDSWERSLRAANVADATHHTYLKVLRYLLDYWEAHDGPERVGEVTRADCEAYLADYLAGHHKPSTAVTYHAIIGIFFRWCVSEDELAASPMERVRRPIVPDSDAPAPVLSPEHVSALLRGCGGKSFEDRRDLAMLRLMFDTGIRRDEVYQLQLADLNLNASEIAIHRKGRKERTRPFSARTAAALDRYLRARDAHKHAGNPALWLSQRGRLSYASIYRIVSRRAEAAGIGHIWPHLARHTFSGHWIKRGGNESTLATFNDWSPRSAHKMIYRYTREQQRELAMEEHKRLAPGDQY